MAIKHVCPWWFCFTFDNPLRRLFQNPKKILAPYVREGDTVIDIGPGMGYFTISLAELVGSSGRVVAVDVQQKMLDFLIARARRRGVAERIVPHLSSPESIGINEKADFVLAFWMLHEVPDQELFLREVRSVLKPQGLLLLAEPIMHVRRKKFLQTIQLAEEVGFLLKDTPRISLSFAAVFETPLAH